MVSCTVASYWTLLDKVDLTPVEEVDEFLRHVRFGRDQAKSTTATYASGLKLYLLWCARTGPDCYEAAGRLGAFMFWLRHADADGGSTVVAGPGSRPVRGRGG